MFVNFLAGSNPRSATKEDLLSVEFYTQKQAGDKLVPFGPQMISSHGSKQLNVGLSMLDDPAVQFDLKCAVGDAVEF